MIIVLRHAINGTLGSLSCSKYTYCHAWRCRLCLWMCKFVYLVFISIKSHMTTHILTYTFRWHIQEKCITKHAQFNVLVNHYTKFAEAGTRESQEESNLGSDYPMVPESKHFLIKIEVNRSNESKNTQELQLISIFLSKQESIETIKQNL